MSNFYINTEKGISKAEIKAVNDSFKGLNPKINPSRIRLSEGALPLIIDFSISAIVGGILWDAVKSSIQSLLKKEGREIKRKITIQVQYKHRSIYITNDDIKIFGEEVISTVTIEEAIEIIDQEDS